MDHAWEANASTLPPATPTSPSIGYPSDALPTLPGAWWFYMLTEEMRNVILAAGLTPNFQSVSQLTAAIQAMIEQRDSNYAVDTGVANSIDVALNPAITLMDGMIINIKCAATNTGPVTINLNGLGAQAAIGVTGNLEAGSLVAGNPYEFQYLLSALSWVLKSNANVVPAANVAANGVPPGSIIDFGGTVAPAGFLACPTAAGGAQLVSRTAYAALFVAIGTTWGIGDGSTTFGIPWFPADYAAIQANANVGTDSLGVVIAHDHVINSTGDALLTTGSAAVSPSYSPGSVSGITGGPANLAAGVRVLKCVKC